MTVHNLVVGVPPEPPDPPRRGWSTVIRNTSGSVTAVSVLVETVVRSHADSPLYLTLIDNSACYTAIGGAALFWMTRAGTTARKLWREHGPEVVIIRRRRR